jgi:hypothetical protein
MGKKVKLILYFLLIWAISIIGIDAICSRNGASEVFTIIATIAIGIASTIVMYMYNVEKDD